MTDITSIGILAHPMRPESFPFAAKIKQVLRQRGLKTWLHTAWKEADVRQPVGEVDMVVAIGGDGAMLRAARVCAPFDVPVLGINMGQLGFLTEIARPEDWEPEVDKVLSGAYWIEQRSMIRAEILQNGATIAQGDALNDVVVSSDRFGRMVRLELFIDKDWATSYSADALVIATATGSTAYALSCGGPILPPELTNILIIPSAPHLSMERPIVLAKGAHVAVKASTSNRNTTIVSIDGMVLGEVPAEGGRVEVTTSQFVARFIRLRGRNYFYRSLLDRLEPRVRRTGEEQ